MHYHIIMSCSQKDIGFYFPFYRFASQQFWSNKAPCNGTKTTQEKGEEQIQTKMVLELQKMATGEKIETAITKEKEENKE